MVVLQLIFVLLIGCYSFQVQRLGCFNNKGD